MRKFWILSFFVAAIFGCGRYLPPLPPEVLAPSAVETLEVSANLESVNFNWQGPDNDRRGQGLRSMDGYNIYRKELQKPADLINKDVPYEVIATMPDTHIETLQKLKEEALAAGKPTRKIKVDEASKKFSYSDKEVKPGKLYAYRIVPYNQGGVEGAVNKIVKVLYRGDSSEIVLIDETAVETEDFEF